MWSCANCGAEVTDKFDICWGCGTSREGVKDPSFRTEEDGIITEEEFEADRLARTQEKLITIASFFTFPPAYGLCSFLESNGVRATVVGENVAGVWGTLYTGSLAGIKVQVFESDADRVREILAAHPNSFQDNWDQADADRAEQDEEDEDDEEME